MVQYYEQNDNNDNVTYSKSNTVVCQCVLTTNTTKINIVLDQFI